MTRSVGSTYILKVPKWEYKRIVTHDFDEESKRLGQDHWEIFQVDESQGRFYIFAKRMTSEW